MERDDARSGWLGVRILLALPTLVCLQLPGWWKLTAIVPGAMVVFGVPRRRGVRDWDVPQQRGLFPLEVVGVHHYTERLAAVLAGLDLTGDGSDVVVPATLVAEPTNPLDPHAVAVHIDGAPVGHLAPGLAAAAQPAVLDLGRAGLRPRVNALVHGRLDGHGRLTVGVRLDLEGFEALRPAGGARS